MGYGIIHGSKELWNVFARRKLFFKPAQSSDKGTLWDITLSKTNKREIGRFIYAFINGFFGLSVNQNYQ